MAPGVLADSLMLVVRMTASREDLKLVNSCHGTRSHSLNLFPLLAVCASATLLINTPGSQLTYCGLLGFHPR